MALTLVLPFALFLLCSAAAAAEPSAAVEELSVLSPGNSPVRRLASLLPLHDIPRLQRTALLGTHGGALWQWFVRLVIQVKGGAGQL